MCWWFSLKLISPTSWNLLHILSFTGAHTHVYCSYVKQIYYQGNAMLLGVKTLMPSSGITHIIAIYLYFYLFYECPKGCYNMYLNFSLVFQVRWSTSPPISTYWYFVTLHCHINKYLGTKLLSLLTIPVICLSVCSWYPSQSTNCFSDLLN